MAAVAAVTAVAVVEMTEAELRINDSRSLVLCASKRFFLIFFLFFF